MKAILLSAGYGTRLRPLTNNLPKCLVKVQNKPLLYYWLNKLINFGIDKIIVNTHYLSHLVEEYISTSEFKEYVILSHEPNLLGTGGSILNNAHIIEKSPFIVAHADNLSNCNLNDLVNAHTLRNRSTILTMATFITNDYKSCGIVKIDKNNILLDFYEKSHIFHGNVANAAIYVCEPSVVDVLKSFNKREIDISTELIPNLYGKIQCHHITSYHQDIGNLQNLEKAQKEYSDDL